MTDDDSPFVVYSGHNMESVFLRSLLESSGISAFLSDHSVGGDVDVRVSVAKSDVERARPLVEHFRHHGKKTTPP